MEHGCADAFGLVETVDRLPQGVVIGVTDRPDRRTDPFESEVVGEVHRCVLRARVKWWIRPVPTGCPSRSRAHNAMRSGTSTKRTSLLVAACHPTIFWAKQSRMNAT